jgi:hypothetical protein
MHDAVRKILKSYSYDTYDYERKDGPLLQLLGTEWGRELDPNIWVNLLKGHYQKTLEAYESEGGEEGKYIYIVEDCRFKNELFDFPEAFSIRLEASEDVRKVRCAMWRDRTDHPSETDLDEAARTGQFDIVINADVNDEQRVLKMAVTTILDPILYRDKHGITKILERPGTDAPPEIHS